MKSRIIFLICCLIVGNIYGKTAYPIPSSLAIANTSVADERSWYGFHSPASLSYLNKPQLSLMAESRYIITALNSKSFTFAYPTNDVVAGLAFSYFGFSLYHEMLFGLGFSRNFSSKFSLGIQFNCATCYFYPSNRYYGAIFPQIGFLFPLHSNLVLGVHIFNPFQTDIKSKLNAKQLPSFFSVGCSYTFLPNVRMKIQVDKEVRSNYRFATGFDYIVLHDFKVKIGAYGSDFLVPCVGFGFNLKYFSMDLNAEMHPLLGLNTIAGIHVRIFP